MASNPVSQLWALSKLAFAFELIAGVLLVFGIWRHGLTLSDPVLGCLGFQVLASLLFWAERRRAARHTD